MLPGNYNADGDCCSIEDELRPLMLPVGHKMFFCFRDLDEERDKERCCQR